MPPSSDDTASDSRTKGPSAGPSAAAWVTVDALPGDADPAAISAAIAALGPAPADGRVVSVSHGRVVVLSIDRPAKKNACTLVMYEALTAGLNAAAADPSVRAVLIRGEGGSFTAGNDLADFMKRPPTSADTPVFRLLTTLAGYQKPLVAAVRGPAVGLGVTMLLHCDLAYAGTSARFKAPFVDLGLVPEGASTLLLPRMAGHVRAFETLVLGEPFDAAAARELGLVNAVVADDELDAFALAKAHALAAKAPGALRAAKALLKHASATDVEAALHREGEQFIARLTSPEARESFMAFFEKRAPRFDD